MPVEMQSLGGRSHWRILTWTPIQVRRYGSVDPDRRIAGTESHIRIEVECCPKGTVIAHLNAVLVKAESTHLVTLPDLF